MDIDNENMEVNFEDEGESSDEVDALSDESAYNSDQSEDLEKIVKKVVTTAEIRALNRSTKFCMIQCYYITSDSLAVCATCMINIADIERETLCNFRKHETNFIDALNGRSCSNCRMPMYTVFPCNNCPECT